MNRELLTDMLGHTKDLKIKSGVCSVPEGASLTVLLKSEAGGPAPLSKVEGLELLETFAVLNSDGARYILPYTVIVGIKVKARGEKGGVRTGFHA